MWWFLAVTIVVSVLILATAAHNMRFVIGFIAALVLVWAVGTAIIAGALESGDCGTHPATVNC